MNITVEERVKKAHIALMKHPETALWSGIMMMGESTVKDDPNMTAYTDGVNKHYGRAFVMKEVKTDQDMAGLVLHENLHVGLRQLIHNRDLFIEDRQRAGMAADYAVNDIIMNIKDKTLVTLPDGGLYDPQYHNMSMREIYRLLPPPNGGNSGSNPGGPGDKGSGYPEPLDEHDVSKDLTLEEVKDIDAKVDRAMREGALLAGRLGINLPRSITDMFIPKVDWREVLREYIMAATRGNDEYTWKAFDIPLLANDILQPTVENETIGEIVVAIDTSGSIGQDQINEFATELASICESTRPDTVRVLWWDTMVHGVQTFTEKDYDKLHALLKPQGGGGTRVGCVSEYVLRENIKAECLLVFTDGYVETTPVWNVKVPTLWLVTQLKSWVPPTGKLVHFD